MRKMIISLDFFAPSPSLYINTQSGYKTFFGAIITAAAFIAIGSFILYFFINFICGQEFYTTSSKETDFSPDLNLSSGIFIYRLVSSSGDVITKDIASVDIRLYNHTGNVRINTRLNTSTCEQEKDFSQFKDVNISDLETYTCIDKSHNLTLSNHEGSVRENIYLNLYIKRCRNTSSVNYCADTETIDTAMSKGIYYEPVIETSGIDHKNRTSPIKRSISRNSILASGGTLQVNYYFFRKVIYTSDDGAVFEDIKTYEKFSFDMKDKTTEIFTDATAIGPKGTMMTMQYSIYNNYADKYTRTYSKFQSFLANVGGICNLIMIIAQMVEFFCVQDLMFKDIFLKSEKKRLSSEPIHSERMKRLKSKRGSIIIPTDKSEKDEKDKMDNREKTESICSKTVTTRGSKQIKKRDRERYNNNIGILDSLFHQICFCKRGKNSKYKFLEECQSIVKQRLSCEEIMSTNETLRTMITKNDTYDMLFKSINKMERLERKKSSKKIEMKRSFGKKNDSQPNSNGFN